MLLPWYSAPTIMHGIFWMVIDHSGTFYCSAPTVMYGIFDILYFLGVTPACVWCCDASTFTEDENHQTSNINIKYSGGHNKKRAMAKNGSSRCFSAKNECTLKTIAAESVVGRI